MRSSIDGDSDDNFVLILQSIPLPLGAGASWCRYLHPNAGTGAQIIRKRKDFHRNQRKLIIGRQVGGVFLEVGRYRPGGCRLFGVQFAPTRAQPSVLDVDLASIQAHLTQGDLQVDIGYRSMHVEIRRRGSGEE